MTEQSMPQAAFAASAATADKIIDDILHTPAAYTDAERERLVELRRQVAELPAHLAPGGRTPLGHATMLGEAARCVREASDILAAAHHRDAAGQAPAP